MLAGRSLAALLLIVAPSLVSAASNVPHYASLRGGAAQNAATDYTTTASPTVLDLVDVTLNAPKGAATCASVDVTWTWDMTGTPPSDPIAISIIDASILGAVTTRRRKRGPSRHTEWKPVSDFLSKRAASIRGTVLPGAGSIPFNEISYTWNPVNVSPGSYRLLLTIVSSGEAVVSDPFGIQEGSTACFSNAASSTSSAASSSTEPSSTSSAVPTASSSDIDSSATSTAAPAPSNPSSSSSTSSSPTTASDSNAASPSSSSGDHSHKAVIAASVAAPLLLLVVFIYGWRLWKKQSSERNQGGNDSSRPVWTEKFFGGGGNASGDAALLRSASTTRPTGHRREISGPGLATPAGLAAVAGMVPVELRKEKDEMALRAVPPPNVPYSPDPQDHEDRPDHWIDFSDHDVQGARPLSAATIADSARLEPRDNSGKPAGLYGQGRNVPLRPESSQCPSTGDSASISTFGNDPLISTFGNDPVTSTSGNRASNTSGVSLGRDLIAAMPQPPSHKHSAPSSSTHSIISPFADPPAAEELSRALSQHHGETEAAQTSVDSSTDRLPTVQRSDSSGSSFGIKRKPVPRISVNGGSTDTAIGGASADEGPFGNEHAVEPTDTSALTSIPIQSVADARAPSPVELMVPREPIARERGSDDGDQPYHLSVARQSGFDINFSSSEDDKPAADGAKPSA